MSSICVGFFDVDLCDEETFLQCSSHSPSRPKSLFSNHSFQQPCGDDQRCRVSPEPKDPPSNSSHTESALHETASFLRRKPLRNTARRRKVFPDILRGFMRSEDWSNARLYPESFDARSTTSKTNEHALRAADHWWVFLSISERDTGSCLDHHTHADARASRNADPWHWQSLTPGFAQTTFELLDALQTHLAPPLSTALSILQTMRSSSRSLPCSRPLPIPWHQHHPPLAKLLTVILHCLERNTTLCRLRRQAFRQPERTRRCVPGLSRLFRCLNDQQLSRLLPWRVNMDPEEPHPLNCPRQLNERLQTATNQGELREVLAVREGFSSHAELRHTSFDSKRW